MAVFHYKIALLPRAHFGQQLPTVLSETDVDAGENVASDWWSSHPPSSELLTALRTLLPMDKSWPGGDVEEWSGGDWGSDIRIWKDFGKVWAITFRFSTVSDDWPLMQRFLAIAREHQCLLLEQRSGLLIEPREDVVQERLAASRAMQFLRDPKGTIVQAAREVKDEAG